VPTENPIIVTYLNYFSEMLCRTIQDETDLIERVACAPSACDVEFMKMLECLLRLNATREKTLQEIVVHLTLLKMKTEVKDV